LAIKNIINYIKHWRGGVVYQKTNILKKVIEPVMEGWTVERVLRQELGMSRSLLRSAKKLGAIFINGQPVNSNERVKAGEVLEVCLVKEASSVIPQQMELAILYEDSDFLAVNKPPGMLVHPLTTEVTGTLANGVLYHWLQQGSADRFRPVHRLDRDTSGLVLVAKNAYMHHQLARQISAGRLSRRYLAVVEGHLQEEKGTIRAPIGLAEGSIIKRAVRTDGKPAVSHYRVLRQWPAGSLVMVELATGRTHQVRVHMAHRGHPLLGDCLYGGDDSIIKRQALHCAYLAFRHPVSGQLLKLACPLPGDMKELIRVMAQAGSQD